MARVSDRELAYINRWQRNFPLVERPFAASGQEVGWSEEETLAALRGMSERGIISRIGAVVRPNTVGASTLAALSAPAERLDEVARIVSDQPEVTHNYERGHELNLWFVVTAADRAAVLAALARIRKLTGLEVLDLPMVRAHHIDLGFALPRAGARGDRGGKVVSPCVAAHPAAGGGAECSPFARQLLAAIEDGLPLVERPYAEVGRRLGVSAAVVMETLDGLGRNGVISRFGLVVHHRELGFSANAMVVWDFPDEVVEKAAAIIAGEDRVTLCYERPRRLPRWRYNLFCMIHGSSREEVLAVVDKLAEKLRRDTGLGEVAHEALFSLRRFKQCGARFSAGLKKGAA